MFPLCLLFFLAVQCEHQNAKNQHAITNVDNINVKREVRGNVFVSQWKRFTEIRYFRMHR